MRDTDLNRLPMASGNRRSMGVCAALIGVLAWSCAALAQFPSYNIIRLTRAPLAGAQNAAFEPSLNSSMILAGSQGVLTPTGFGFDAYLAHAVVWTVAGGTQEVLLPPGVAAGYPAEWRAIAVNASGTALINYTNSSQPLGQRSRVFTRTSAGVWTELSAANISGVTSLSGTTITDGGTVFGTVVSNSTLYQQVRWTSASTVQVLPIPASPAPQNPNNNWQIIDSPGNGWLLVRYAPVGGGVNFSYTINPAGAIDHTFGAVPGLVSGPSRINSLGQAVGTAGTTIPQHPIRWDATGAPTDLYVADFNIGGAINDAGWVIGESNVGAVKKLYIPGAGVVNVLTRINPGQLLAGETLGTLGDINNNGQIFATVGGIPAILTPDNTCPIISQHPPAQLATCNSGVFTLTCAGYAGLPISYQWRRNSQTLTGQTGPTLTINGSYIDEGLYDCVLSTTCGNAVTSPCEVQINLPRCGPSDVAGANQSVRPCGDGLLTADDIIVFLGWFFAGDIRADVAGPNQSTTPDGNFSADDIIVFLGRYFAGC